MHLLFRRNRQLVSQALMEDHVYMGHRRFLPIKHPLRRRHGHYGGKADHRTKPRHRCGKMVFEMVKDIKVVFGKGLGIRSVQSDDDRAPMWKKKKSIF